MKNSICNLDKNKNIKDLHLLLLQRWKDKIEDKDKHIEVGQMILGNYDTLKAPRLSSKL